MSIRVENINKQFGNKQVLHDISFEIKEQETCVILGPSGCGKTTLLEIISGLQKQDSGKIFFGEDDISYLEPKMRNVSMVFQNNALYPNMTVFENVEFPLKIKKVEKLKRREQVNKALALVDMTDKKDRSVNDLSGGEKKRTAIARALIVNPKLFIMDEPLSSLDASLRSKTRKEILRIKNETKTTLLYVTHDQNEALNIADKIIVMNEGRVIQIGTPKELLANPINLFVLETFFQDSLNIVNKLEFEKTFGKTLSCEKVAFLSDALEICDKGAEFKIKSKDIHTHYKLVTVTNNEIELIFKTNIDYNINDVVKLKVNNNIYLF